MPTRKANLIAHPVRARILTTLMGRSLTTQQIVELLPDVPLPSVYRHVRLLAENGIIEPVEEVRVHGALTKVYAVVKGQTRIHQEDVEDATRSDHLHYFTTFLNTLADTFRSTLENEAHEQIAAKMQCLMDPLYLNSEEFPAFCDALQEFLKAWREKPSEQRQRFLFAHILLPDQETPPLN